MSWHTFNVNPVKCAYHTGQISSDATSAPINRLGSGHIRFWPYICKISASPLKNNIRLYNWATGELVKAD